MGRSCLDCVECEQFEGDYGCCISGHFIEDEIGEVCDGYEKRND